MKVAEALAERADLDKKLAQLIQRIKKVARYTDGEEPLEDAQELLGEARDILTRREHLIARINQTNAVAELEPGVTITQAIARRDRLNAERNMLNELATAAGGEHDIYYGRRRSELPMKTDLRVKDMRASADRLAKSYRELDTKIQQSNWTVDLI